jgi:hypothetical protein
LAIAAVAFSEPTSPSAVLICSAISVIALLRSS